MPKTRSGFTLLKAPESEKGHKGEGPPPFEVPNKSLPYWLGKGATVVSDEEQEELEELEEQLDLSKLDEPALRALAESRGIDTSTLKSQKALREALGGEG